MIGFLNLLTLIITKHIIYMKKILIIITSIIVAILIIVFTVIKNEKQVKSNAPIVIGAALALTGDASAWGEMSLKGAKLAVEEININGGIRGRNIQLSVEDTQSTSQGALSSVSKLLSINKAEAILGPSWLDVYHGAEGLIEGKDVLMITPDSGAEAMHDNIKMPGLFSTWYRTAPKAQLLANHINDIGKKHLFIIHPNDLCYILYANFLKKFAKEKGIIIESAMLGTDAKDIRTLLLKIKQSGADSVFFTAYDPENMNEFLKNYRIILPDVSAYSDEIFKDFVGKEEYAGLADGIEYFHAIAPVPSFQKKFTERYSADPVFGASTAYDAIYIIADALENTDNNYDAYVRSHSFDTVSYGKATFDNIGGIVIKSNQFDLFTVENNQSKKIE